MIVFDTNSNSSPELYPIVTTSVLKCILNTLGLLENPPNKKNLESCQMPPNEK